MASSVVRTFHLVLAVIVLCLDSPTTGRTEVLRTGGTGSIYEALRSLGAAFAATDPGTTIEVIPSLGSSGGIAAVADGALDFSVSSRPLKPEEVALNLKETVFACTPFVLVSSHPNPNGLKSIELAAFFESTTSVWADGTPVRVILRPKSESDTTILGDMFPGMATAIDQVRMRPEVPVAATDQDNAQMAEKIPGSFVAATYTQIVTEKRDLRLVDIDGVEPTLENFERGAYPFTKKYHLVFQPKKSPVVERFIAFLISPDGEKILRDTGNLSACP